ncbi:AAA family ATPase [Planctomicrobium piriforme]|nr:AAA family ATPase [Planctomicrobium piriforme]
MASSPANRTGRQLLKALRTSVARFYPCDLHVHSPSSYDVCQSGKLEKLPDNLREKVLEIAKTASYSLPLSKEPSDPEAFDKAMATPELISLFLKELSIRRDRICESEGLSESDNWCIVAITDHNTSHFSCNLAKEAWATKATNKVVVLPGIELDISFDVLGAQNKCQVHVLCLFTPCTTASDIRLAINTARPAKSPPWNMGQPIVISDLSQFIDTLRSNLDYPAICIAAHVWSKKGVQSEPSKTIFAHFDAEIARLEGELSRAQQDGSTIDASEIGVRLDKVKAERKDVNAIHLDVLRMIGTCGFDALQVRDQSHETHYRRLHRFREKQGRGVPIVCSDAHTPDHIFQCVSGIPFAKLSASALSNGSPADVFGEIRDRVLRFGETRTTYASPGTVTYWIEGIEITRDAQNASKFWNHPGEQGPQADTFTLELSRNLNCFVGGRGSGKSAGIEAIAFLAQSQPFIEEANTKTPSDWYLRAKATLSGCGVRAVWKSTATEGIGALPKKALIVSRYFDPQGSHQPVEMRDADDKTIVDSSIKIPPVRLLRVHEIEETARPQNLRLLFDGLCGPGIIELTEKIEALRSELKAQRSDILSEVAILTGLTVEGSALRQYAIRKRQFDDVNKPELQDRFQDVDKAAEAVQLAISTETAWENLGLEASLDELVQGTETFFDVAAEAIPNAGGENADHHTPLAELLGGLKSSKDEEQEETESVSTGREQLVSALRAAKDSASLFNDRIEDVKVDAVRNHTSKIDSLAKQGVPAGSKERAAKKLAFEEAKGDLAKYETALTQLYALLKSRDEIHAHLVQAGKERTELRQQCAATISLQLARDLDPAVLHIELVANPMQDQAELERWLTRNIGPLIKQHKVARIAALLKSGLMPRFYRELLLHDGTPDLSALTNEHKSAADGKLDSDAASSIFASCRGLRRVPLDEVGAMSEEFEASLPESIRAGVLIFPVVLGSVESCIERVLELDEVVLNDSAEVRLNDRPTDPESEPRPLDELSPGQRCSAILPILLLSGDYPLIIDQPEENLDNRLIRQVIVNILASMKLRRQVIVATHNPNLPVLGDAEQCVVLQARGRNLSDVVATGNLDSPDVARFITDIMEGGREAFQYRQSIYQNHWKGPVE